MFDVLEWCRRRHIIQSTAGGGGQHTRPERRGGEETERGGGRETETRGRHFLHSKLLGPRLTKS